MVVFYCVVEKLNFVNGKMNASFDSIVFSTVDCFNFNNFQYGSMVSLSKTGNRSYVGRQHLIPSFLSRMEKSLTVALLVIVNQKEIVLAHKLSFDFSSKSAGVWLFCVDESQLQFFLTS